MASNVKTIELQNGIMPMIGLGCYYGLPKTLNHAEVQSWVEQAIEEGYRHFDTAYLYQTEVAVGKAIKKKIETGLIKREDVFITSKLSFAHHLPENVRICVKESLARLGTEYIDLYLMHAPFGVKMPEDIQDCLTHTLPSDDSAGYINAWKTLEEFVENGFIKSIGVSNFNSQQVQDILDNCKVKPALNQIEMHVYYQNTSVRDFCKSRGVEVEAYCPLGQVHSSVQPKDWASPLQDECILDLAKKYGKTPAQIVLKFLVQQGIVVVPCSSNRSRQAENLKLFDFKIESGDMKKIEALERGQKYLKLEHYKHHKEYPFHGAF